MTQKSNIIEQLRRTFSYDPVSGIFVWNIDHFGGRGVRKGRRAGHRKPDGYYALKLCGKEIRAHRAAWMIFYGETPPSMIDHIDGNPSNNSISNLRPANDVENQRNRAGVRGFYVEKRSYGDVYRAYIHVLGRQITLGCFPSADLAKSARIEAEKKYFGEFAADRESVCQ